MNALVVNDVAISFGGVHAVKSVSLMLAAGERHVLLGPNGAGKTTLFNMIAGQLAPDRGTIAFFGRDLTRWRPSQRAHAGLARTFQITTLFPSLSIEENIFLAIQALSPTRYNLFRSADSVVETRTRLEALLQEWRFGTERGMIVRDLSYGEQRKLELAMALCHKPRLLLLDEPTAGLSTGETENIVGLIRGLSRDVTVLVIEHDMIVAFEIGERFTIMNQGAVVAVGTAADIRANAEIQSIYFGEAK